MFRHSVKAECRSPASLEELFRGPGGRHVSTTAAHRFARPDPFSLRALLRLRRFLLSLRGLHRAGASLLLRRPALLPFWAQLLRASASLLCATASLLFGAALLPTGPALLPPRRVPALPKPGVGRPLGQWRAWTRFRPRRWPRRSPLNILKNKRRIMRRFL